MLRIVTQKNLETAVLELRLRISLLKVSVLGERWFTPVPHSNYYYGIPFFIYYIFMSVIEENPS